MDASSLTFLRRLAKALPPAVSARDVRALARARKAFACLQQASDEDVATYLTLNRAQFVLASESSAATWAEAIAQDEIAPSLISLLTRDVMQLIQFRAPGFTVEDLASLHDDRFRLFLRAAATVITDPAVLRDPPALLVDPQGDSDIMTRIVSEMRQMHPSRIADIATRDHASAHPSDPTPGDSDEQVTPEDTPTTVFQHDLLRYHYASGNSPLVVIASREPGRWAKHVIPERTLVVDVNDGVGACRDLVRFVTASPAWPFLIWDMTTTSNDIETVGSDFDQALMVAGRTPLRRFH